MKKIETDRFITLALSKGNEKVFDTVFLDYFPKLKKFIKGFINNEEESENIVQDLFMNLWINHKLLADVDNLNAYLYSIAKNAVFHFLRNSSKHQFRSLEEGENILENGSNAEDDLYIEELLSVIRFEIEQMPPQRRRIFKMSRFENLSNEQIAQRLNISKRTVETHISLTLSELRKILFIIILLFINKI